MTCPPRAFTITELLVVIFILALVLGYTLPAVSNIRGAAAAVRCASNLRQLGVFFSDYQIRNRQAIPLPSGTDFSTVFEAIGSNAVRCPLEIELQNTWTYPVNRYVLTYESFRRIPTSISDPQGLSPSEVILAGENRPGVNSYFQSQISRDPLGYYVWSSDPAKHGKIRRSNHLWLDLHVSNELVKRYAPPYDSWNVVPASGR